MFIIILILLVVLWIFFRDRTKCETFGCSEPIRPYSRKKKWDTFVRLVAPFSDGIRMRDSEPREAIRMSDALIEATQNYATNDWGEIMKHKYSQHSVWGSIYIFRVSYELNPNFPWRTILANLDGIALEKDQNFMIRNADGKVLSNNLGQLTWEDQDGDIWQQWRHLSGGQLVPTGEPGLALDTQTILSNKVGLYPIASHKYQKWEVRNGTDLFNMGFKKYMGNESNLSSEPGATITKL